MTGSRRMSFGDHLEELRRRLLLSALVIVAVCVVAFFYQKPLMNLAYDPVQTALQKHGGALMNTKPTEGFITTLKVVFYTSLFASSPFWLYQVWAFVSAGLYPHERRSVLIFGPFSVVLFLAGAFMAYRYMVPISADFLLGFGLGESKWTLEHSLSFCTSLLLAMGIVFETPLVMLFLNFIGVGTPPFYRHYRRHFILGAAVLSAVLTPSDIASMMLMAIPLVLLYEVGILLVAWFGRKTVRGSNA